MISAIGHPAFQDIGIGCQKQNKSVEHYTVVLVKGAH